MTKLVLCLILVGLIGMAKAMFFLEEKEDGYEPPLCYSGTTTFKSHYVTAPVRCKAGQICQTKMEHQPNGQYYMYASCKEKDACKNNVKNNVNTCKGKKNQAQVCFHCCPWDYCNSPHNWWW